MCGIAGMYWSGSRPSGAESAVNRMVRAIHHRGPDSDGRASNGFSEVGFKRLAIIDLSSGDQPLANEDGSVECFLNGEIYNYRSLRDDLIKRGHIFRTTSDTEVLPHLYEEHREGMFAKLNGMFSIVVIDHRRRSVLLARDQFGVKQLYYAQTPHGIVFASEVKAILASGLVEPEVDQASLVPYLTLFYSPEPWTLIRGVKKLPPSTFLRLAGGNQPEPTKYYEFPSVARQLRISSTEALERAAELLTESVKLQMQADVPVGISLSGGIDSSAIAWIVGSLQDSAKQPLAVTIDWPNTSPAEVESAKSLCESLQIEQLILKPKVRKFEEDLPLLAWISDEPIADPATYSQFCIAQAAAAQVKVLLSGAGGDELFGGYGSYILPWRKTLYASLPAAAQQVLFALGVRNRIDQESADALAAHGSSRYLWHRKAMSNIGREEEAYLRQAVQGSRNTFDNFYQLFNSYQGYDPASLQMMVDLQSYLPEQILPMMDRATMAASIEGRVPFLDIPLAEFCFSLGDRMKLGWPPSAKRLLKQFIADKVPSQIIRRQKCGMPSPFQAFIAEHPMVVRELLFSEDGYLKSVLPRQWLEQVASGTQQQESHFRMLYSLVVFEVWHKLFIRERHYAKPTMDLSDLFKIPSRMMQA